MTNPNRISNGEVIARKYISRTGYKFGDDTYQETAMGLLTRYTPNFQATGLTYTGTSTNHPCYDSHYIKHLQMVTFSIKVNLATVTNFGTGQFKLELPFMPYDAIANHFPAWCWVDPTQPPDELNGHVILQADHLPNSKTLDLHWLQSTTANPKPIIEKLFIQGNPVTLTTSSLLYVNGTYISNE
jgi:hypothetical protein